MPYKTMLILSQICPPSLITCRPVARAMSRQRPKGKTLSALGLFIVRVGTWLICTGKKMGNSVEVDPEGVGLDKRWNVKLDRRVY